MAATWPSGSQKSADHRAGSGRTSVFDIFHGNRQTPHQDHENPHPPLRPAHRRFRRGTETPGARLDGRPGAQHEGDAPQGRERHRRPPAPRRARGLLPGGETLRGRPGVCREIPSRTRGNRIRGGGGGTLRRSEFRRRLARPRHLRGRSRDRDRHGGRGGTGASSTSPRTTATTAMSASRNPW